jgi:serine/threonine protein phosphatase PrpC
MKSYKQKKYEQALIETYLKFDELLRKEKVNQFLIQHYDKDGKEGKDSSRLDVTFAYNSNNQGNQSADINQTDVEIMNKEEKKSPISSERKKEGSKNSKISKNSKEENRISLSKNTITTKEVVIDLTVKKEDGFSGEGISPRSRRSEESTSQSKEILTMDNQKIVISLRKNSDDTANIENYDELIAKDMGTTANIMLIKNNYLYLANVGDSMAVLFKNGQAVRLNQEHKTTLPSEFSRISKSGAKIIHNRIDGRLNLTRAIGKYIFYIINIGDLNFKRNANLKFYEQAVTAYPEITKMKITKDFDFIIMACDGVWDCVEVQKLCEHISIKLKSKVKISTIIGELMDQIISKTNNSKNILIILIYLFSACWN